MDKFSKKSSYYRFLSGISHTLLSRANFICRREQSVCHVVSTWREDWVPLAKIFCGGIPVSVITLMTLLFIGCCFMAHFDLVLRLGGSLRPKILVLETLAAEIIFDVPFIIRWVNISFLYMCEILG